MGHCREGKCGREADEAGVNDWTPLFNELNQRPCDAEWLTLHLARIRSPIQDFRGTSQAKLRLIERG
jgi:hypothetical protein